MEVINIEKIFENIEGSYSSSAKDAKYISSISGVELNPEIRVSVSWESLGYSSRYKDFKGVKFSFDDQSEGLKTVWRMVKVGKDNQVDIAKLAKTVEVMNELYALSLERLEVKKERQQLQDRKLSLNNKKWQELGYKQDWGSYYDIGSNQSSILDYSVKSSGVSIKIDDLTPEDADKVIKFIQELSVQAECGV